MGRILDKNLYPIDLNVSKDDYFIGTDIDNNLKTVNFNVGSLISLIQSELNFSAVDYRYSDGTDGEITAGSQGYFLTNPSNDNPETVTKLYINKNNAAGQDLSSLFDFMVANVYTFSVKLINTSNPSQTFYFKITAGVDNDDHVEFDITAVGAGYTESLTNLSSYNIFFEVIGAQNNVNLIKAVSVTGEPTASSVASAFNSVTQFVVSDEQNLYLSVTSDLGHEQVYVLKGKGKGTYGSGAPAIASSDLQLIAKVSEGGAQVFNNKIINVSFSGVQNNANVIAAVNSSAAFSVANGDNVFFYATPDAGGPTYVYLTKDVAVGDYGTGNTALAESNIELISVLGADDNKYLIKEYSITGAMTNSAAAAAINSAAQFSVLEDQVALHYITTDTSTSKFVFATKNKGKGTYGVGGTTLAGTDLELVSELRASNKTVDKYVDSVNLTTDDAEGLATYFNALATDIIKKEEESWLINITSNSEVVKTFSLVNVGATVIGATGSVLTEENFMEIVSASTYTKVNDFSNFDGPVFDARTASDGSIYVYGNFTQYKGESAPTLLKLNPDGTRNLTWQATGGNGVENYAKNLHVNTDGTVYVAGAFTQFNGAAANRIIKLKADGTKDTSFAIGTGFDGNVTGILEDAGKLYCIGTFTSYNGTSCNRVVRLNADGTIDSTFVYGTGLNGTPMSIAKIGTTVFVSGFFTTYNGTGVNNLVSINSNGSINTGFVAKAFNLGGVAGLYVTAHQGKVLCYGGFTTYDGKDKRRMVRLNLDGTLDNTFNTGTGFKQLMVTDTPSATAYIPSVYVDTDDSIYVPLQDSIQMYGTTYIGGTVRLDSTGALVDNYTKMNTPNYGIYKIAGEFYLSSYLAFDPKNYGGYSLSKIDFDRGVEYEYKGYLIKSNGVLITSSNSDEYDTNEENAYISRRDVKGIVKDYLNTVSANLIKLSVNGVEKKVMGQGDTLDIIAGPYIKVEYAAEGKVTISLNAEFPTQAQYDAIPTKDENKLYFITC